MCKTGQPYRWQAKISKRSAGTGSPYKAGRAACPCNDLARNQPEVAAEWDWEANGERTPETVTASSNTKAAWRCGLCGHKWSAQVLKRTQGTGCPPCGHEAGRYKARHPSISSGAPHLLAEWDWEANQRPGWHPGLITLGSPRKVHWVQHKECKLGLVHRWQATVSSRVFLKHGSPFPFGLAVCACNSLAVQCPEAAMLWDHQANGTMTPDTVTVQSAVVACWKAPDGRQWQQRVDQVVNLRSTRHLAKLKN